ncbi:MAG TPA: hypothetical protein VLG11_02035 [Candidatus Saccharimonadales bacterium]|nr:hypothetical protein [Candidatus Saccharimonadales bacterium]
MYFANLYHLFIEQPAGMLLALVTVVVGSFALYLYRRQVYDEKRIAARTIFGEISSAENKLKPIRARFFATQAPSVESVQIMKYESWSRYKHLFLEDLKRDGMWDLVDNFYSNCADYDTAVKISKENLQSVIDQNYKHQYDYYSNKVSEAHKKDPEAKSLPAEDIQDILAWQEMFLSQESRGQFDYFPTHATNLARTALVTLDTSVSASEAGKILKKIAEL